MSIYPVIISLILESRSSRIRELSLEAAVFDLLSLTSLCYLRIFISFGKESWHQEVASDSFCFLINCSWLLVFCSTLVSSRSCPWNLESFLEDLFLGGQSSIILGYRRLSLFSLFLLAWDRVINYDSHLSFQGFLGDRWKRSIRRLSSSA